LIGVGILIPIVYYIEYQDKKSKSKKVIGFWWLFSFLVK
jgi:hypothetical protein